MPTTIDAQNALQIRKPMEIEIIIEAFDDIALNISNSTYSYKIAQFNSITKEYPMRLLSDLQGIGFPLDGTCVLYDSSVAASESDGKIGFRGVVGADIGLRITSPVALEAITIYIDNANTITFSGTTYDATSGEVIVALNGAQTAIITAQRKNSNYRVEVSYISVGFRLSFTQEELISVNLSLRSDLSTVDPSLPESEIEIVAYYPEDISRMLAQIRDNKPLSYRAGYDDDMSITRRFYLSEPARWENKSVVFKAVDAINYLDSKTENIYFGFADLASEVPNPGYVPATYSNIHRVLYNAFCDQIERSGVALVAEETQPPNNSSSSINSSFYSGFMAAQSRREFVANMMNLLHQDYATNYFNGFDAFWLTYVDAGIPTITWSKPSIKWDIYEEDCGDVTSKRDRNISKIKATNGSIFIRWQNRQKLVNSISGESPAGLISVGDANISKNQSMLLSFSEYASQPLLWTNNGSRSFVFRPYVASYVDGSYGNLPPTTNLNKLYGMQLLHGDYWAGWTQSAANISTPSQIWSSLRSGGVIAANDLEESLKMYSAFITVEEKNAEYINQNIGIEITAEKTGWLGAVYAGKYGDSSQRLNILPDAGFRQLLARSNETGSFTWKGDPRMQPRDFFNFHRLDGTVEVCTIEMISLKHEKGGTQAQITYRKGMV